MEEQIKRAKKHFANHVAVLRQLDGISTLDWRNKNGSSCYYVRYIFDEEHCHLCISGDLGSAVVQLSERATLKNLSDYINTVGYFLEKVRCSTDMYTYDYETAKSIISEHLTSVKPNFDEDDEDSAEAYEEFIDEREDIILELMENFSFDKGFQVSRSLCYKLLAIDPNCFEWISNAGKNINERIILWLVGLNMAYHQVNSEEVQS